MATGFTLPGPPTDEDASAWVPTQLVRKRRMLWDIGGSMQCSILGTCLSDNDLLTALRKSRLSVQAGAASYDIHAHCVKMAGSDNILARTLHKMLDKRYAGALRLVSRAETEPEFLAVWTKLRDTNQVGAAYWAILSHTHVPNEVMTQVFGEVHMLSHLHGRGVRDMASQITELQRRNADLEARLRRTEAARNDALTERDAARVAVGTRPSAALATLLPTQVSSTRERRGEERGKRDRVLAAARARARQAEGEVAQLRSALQAMERTLHLDRPLAAPCSCCARREPCRLDGRRILYLGGRKNVLPHLKSAAEAREAVLLVHDGGVEDAAHRIEELVGGCDAVVCPIDCVSHGACRFAKALCRRFNKPFLPIPTASRSGFERALDQLAATPLPTEPANA